MRDYFSGLCLYLSTDPFYTIFLPVPRKPLGYNLFRTDTGEPLKYHTPDVSDMEGSEKWANHVSHNESKSKCVGGWY